MRIILRNNKVLTLTVTDAVSYIQKNGVVNIFGFGGDDPTEAVDKVAYFAGRIVYGKDTTEAIALIGSKLTMLDFYYSKGLLDTTKFDAATVTKLQTDVATEALQWL